MTPCVGSGHYTHMAKPEAVNSWPDNAKKKTHCLTATVVSVVNTFLWGSVRVKVSKLDQPPEVNSSSRKYGIPAHICARTTIPRITLWMGTRIKIRIGTEARGSRHKGISLANFERVAIPWDPQHNLFKWKPCRMPFPHGRNGGTSLILDGSARIVEWCIGSNCRAPRSPDIIIHNRDVVQYFGETRNVGKRVSIWTRKGDYRRCRRKNQIGAKWIFTQLLQKR